MQVVEDAQWGRIALEDPPTMEALEAALEASQYDWEWGDIGLHVYGVSVSNPNREQRVNVDIFFRDDTTEFIHANSDDATHQDLIIALGNFATSVLDTTVEGIYEPEYQFEVVPDSDDEDPPELFDILVELFEDEEVYRDEDGLRQITCEVLGYVFIVYEDGRALPWHEAGWDTGEDSRMFTTYLTDRWRQEQRMPSNSST